ncbi:MAG: hypothetical protein GY803_02095 [Chloroflexi bacterium]|nr:hypothetical protein [Chloroflexota bacterium]
MVGAFLLVASPFWILLSQRHMGQAWRVGIDHNTETDLALNGIYGRSRNSIFLGVLVGLLGLFLVVPNAIALLVWTQGIILIQIQILPEKAHLLKQHGDAYRDYCRRVPCWI